MVFVFVVMVVFNFFKFEWSWFNWFVKIDILDKSVVVFVVWLGFFVNVV